MTPGLRKTVLQAQRDVWMAVVFVWFVTLDAQSVPALEWSEFTLSGRSSRRLVYWAGTDCCTYGAVHGAAAACHGSQASGIACWPWSWTVCRGWN